MITDPVPEAHHDTFAYRYHGLDRSLSIRTTFSLIKATKDSDSSPPTKKPPNRELTDEDRQVNRQLNHHRVVVERVIAHFKCGGYFLLCFADF